MPRTCVSRLPRGGTEERPYESSGTERALLVLHDNVIVLRQYLAPQSGVLSWLNLIGHSMIIYPIAGAYYALQRSPHGGGFIGRGHTHAEPIARGLTRSEVKHVEVECTC